MHTFVILSVTFAIFGLSYFFVIKQKRNMEHVILGAILCIGILTNVIFVPGLVLDEPGHIATAYRYANVWLGKPYEIDNIDGADLEYNHKGILTRREDVEAMNLMGFHGPSKGAYQKVRERFRLFCSDEGSEMIVSYNARSVECGFMGYLFSSIGIAAARILHLGTYPMLYLGRFMNLLFFILCIYWTMRITPVKKWLFGLLALTPMCMQLICSFSYDSPIIGVSFFVTAWMLHLIYQKEQISFKEWLLTSVLAFCLIPCKFTIGPFLLIFLIPKEKYKSKKRKWIFVAIVVVCGVIGLLPQYTEMIAEYIGGLDSMQSNNYNLRSESLYTLGWIANNPKATIQIFLHTIRQQFTFYWTNMLGGRLAVFEPTLDWSLFLHCAFLLASVRDPEDHIILPMKHRVLCMGGFVATVLTTMLLMLFMYTPVGREVIEGVQGRYFLPVLPMLFLFLGMDSITLSEKTKGWLTTIVLSINAAAWIEVLMWIRTFP